MATIRDIHTPWRDALLPAMFDGCPFHVESGARESGRRTVIHEFPKRDLPYAEDMGRRAVEFTVRGYCVSFMRDTIPTAPVDSGSPVSALLYMRDYRLARDVLQQRLDIGGYGILQLPHMARVAAVVDNLTINVVCTRYRMVEEQKFGGYAMFDMSFVEFGLAPAQPVTDTKVQLEAQADGLYKVIISNVGDGQLPLAVPLSSTTIGR